MGDWFQIIVDRDSTEEEAVSVGEDIVKWLIADGIIDADMSECLLGEDLGYPPGPDYRIATGDGDDHWLTLMTNGMEVITGRTVFWGWGDFVLVCDKCATRFEPDEDWGDRVSEWYDRQGPGLISCPQCGHAQSVADWEFDPPWGFGNLGFQFWNWPPLEPSFIDAVTKKLGHRVVFVEGEL